MSPAMLDYFKAKLLAWRQELNGLIEAGRQALQAYPPHQADDLDDITLSQAWVDRSQQLQRHAQLRLQIEAALERLAQGTYGYCQQSGDEIGVDRLRAWPIAELSLQSQAYQEHRLKIMQARQACGLD